MSDEYRDIINLPHHVSSKRPQMSMLDRAAQFSPFAALTGYDDAIHETGRLTDKRLTSVKRKRGAGQKAADPHGKAWRPSCSDRNLLRPGCKEVRRSVCDKERKPQKIDGFERWMMLTDGTKIPLDDVADIESELFRDMF